MQNGSRVFADQTVSRAPRPTERCTAAAGSAVAAAVGRQRDQAQEAATAATCAHVTDSSRAPTDSLPELRRADGVTAQPLDERVGGTRKSRPAAAEWAFRFRWTVGRNSEGRRRVQMMASLHSFAIARGIETHCSFGEASFGAIILLCPELKRKFHPNLSDVSLQLARYRIRHKDFLSRRALNETKERDG